jgi:cbb3-type cytochrome oxidase maturation protein
MFELTAIQFLVALFMGLGALGAFIWAALSGEFTNVEEVAREVYQREAQDDGETNERSA